MNEQKCNFDLNIWGLKAVYLEFGLRLDEGMGKSIHWFFGYIA
jgi:hypothetical protein